MSLASSACSRCCNQILRGARPSTATRPAAVFLAGNGQRIQLGSRRWESSSAAATTESTNPKITAIVDQISQLSLLETADLVSTLKTRLNIPDMPMGGFAAAAPAAAPAAAEAEEDAAPAAQEKTMFSLTLKSIDAASKPKVIKEIKGMLGLSLVDSKKFVESAPKLMKEGVTKEDCEKIIETMKGLGAVVTME